MNNIREFFDLKRWEDFAPTIDSIKQNYGRRTYQSDSGEERTYYADVLFRGHASAEWTLQTTLERRHEAEISIHEYAQSATAYAHELEAYTGRRWHGVSAQELHEFFRAEIANDELSPRLPCREYLIYLRQHGFASPLLDWTSSPYIAAFFAFAPPTQIARGKVAIYVFIEMPHGSKSCSSWCSQITRVGHNARTHSRHFAQQAQYTIATKWLEKEHCFVEHERAFAPRQYAQNQDLLFKIMLPATIRPSVLRYLDEHNLNAYTLFQDESSLVSTMDMREFDIRREAKSR